MTVTNVHKDAEAMTMTITAEFDAAVERVWKLWEDPRLLERWWGPPSYPATFLEHDFTPGGRALYRMTGPEGDRHHGWWRMVTVEAPHKIEFEDGFADEAGAPNDDLPRMTVRVDISARPGGGTTMAVSTVFPSADAMEQLIAMGIEERSLAAMSQIDDILMAESASA